MEEQHSLFMAVLGLHCCTGFSQVAASWACSPAAVHWFLICRGFCCCRSWAVGHKSFSICGPWAQQLWYLLWSTGSVAVARGLSCSAACGIFLDQGSKLCPLHWQAESFFFQAASLPLSHQGSPQPYLCYWTVSSHPTPRLLFLKYHRLCYCGKISLPRRWFSSAWYFSVP